MVRSSVGMWVVLGLCFMVMNPLGAWGKTPASDGPRRSVNINPDWRFCLGDPAGAEGVAFDDAAWQAVGLPHTFSLPYFLSSDFYVGYGWYRKHLTLPETLEGKRVFLEFDAAFQEAEIFLNGTKVGTHRGGYTGFSLDISAAAKPGENLLAVRLNNLWNPRLAPRAGEHTFSGGLYRDVRLLVTGELYMPWCGTSVTTPTVSKESATVRVQTEVTNASAAAKTVTVQHALVAPDGNVVATFQATLTVPANSTAVVDQTSPAIDSPKLWHPDHPHLYTVRTNLLQGDTPADTVATTLGLRWFQWTADRGFFLNGEHLYLRGANVHQDHAGWGDAVTHAAMERDVKMVKAAGFNFIRGSHYPHAPAFVEACDRLGILFWSENVFWGIGGFQPDGYWNSSAYPPQAEDQPDFEASVKPPLREMIRIHRNHPSIVAWSMCNEPFFSDKAVLPKVKSFLQELAQLSRELDPTRPAAIGGCQRPLDDHRIDNTGDLAGYNGDGATIALFQNPGFPNIVSEYSSTTTDRPGPYDPGWGSLSKEKGEPVYAWRSGQAIWCMYDHGSIAGEKLGKMGIVDYFRVPKRAWFWYRNSYAHVAPPAWPVPGTPSKMRLEADKSHGIGNDGTDDALLTVTVLDAAGTPLSNSQPVELSIVSGPGEFPTGPTIRFEPKSDIRIDDGQAAIEIRSYHAGQTVIRATSPGLPPAELTLQFVGETSYVPGVTPGVAVRPYVKFTRERGKAVPQLFGRDNPAFASSSVPGHAAGLATDGNPKTYWQPAAEDAEAWWMVDLEKHVRMSEIRIAFPVEGVYRYWVEVSEDRQQWRVVEDCSRNTEKSAGHVTRLKPEAAGVRVRIRFAAEASAVKPAIQEVQVLGTLLK